MLFGGEKYEKGNEKGEKFIRIRYINTYRKIKIKF
jgi:hypothetical protein